MHNFFVFLFRVFIFALQIEKQIMNKIKITIENKLNWIEWNINPNCINYMRAIGWVSAIIFFSYVGIIKSFLQENVDSSQLYYNVQSQVLSLLINFSIVALLVLDNNYLQIKKSLPILLCMSFIFSILIYGHSLNCSKNNIYGIYDWLCSEWLAIFLYLVYFIITVHIRYLSTKIHTKPHNYIATEV